MILESESLAFEGSITGGMLASLREEREKQNTPRVVAVKLIYS
jgi:hypothetical protein